MSCSLAVLGASSNPDRYSYKAVKMLEEYNYKVFAIHPSKKPIDDLMCFAKLADVGEDIDTITVYLGESNSSPLIGEIINAHPRRIILNPGAENDELEQKCSDAGIQVQHACTLVLLRTNQF